MESKQFNCEHGWDAGELGCGELIMKLSQKIKVLHSGELFELVALDTGGIEDLPSWARLTGNELVLCEPPRYVFKKK